MICRILLIAVVISLLVTLAGCDERTPTPPSRGHWVEARLQAYADLYNITTEGRRMLASLDVRQMTAQPSWFGSTGFRGFAGLGQAQPASVAHELGHSYWGAFPVTGRPDLTWEIPEEGDVSPAMAQYREDLRRFMLQPPDRYEQLRERFRNLPNLMKGDYPDLLHTGEADMVSLVAGDLNLVPPILRKYFDHYLAPGAVGGWDVVFGWYSGLTHDDKRYADAYLGLGHVPKEAYLGLGPSPNPSALAVEEIKEVLRGEERQRLMDFAQQLDIILSREDSLVDASGVNTGFPFWRSYLREMYRLYKDYPGLLAQAEGSGGGDSIVSAFDLLVEAERLPATEKAAFLRERLRGEPFAYNFLPILENRVLVELLDPEAASLEAVVLQKGTGAFVEELRRFIVEVDRILEIGRGDAGAGARALEEYVESLKKQDKDKLKQDLDTVFELFTDTDKQTTEAIMARVQEPAIQELLKANPARTRFLLKPGRLLDALNIRAEASAGEFGEGLKELFENSSGNYEIDKPFTEEAYRRVAERGEVSPQETLGLIKEVHLPMPGFLFSRPMEASAILSSELAGAVELVKESEPVRVPPVKLIYHLIYVDPGLAARIVHALDMEGRDDLVSESLIYFAYDLDRRQSNPQLKISLEGDGLFLRRLVEEQGPEWLSIQMASAIARYQAAIKAEEVDPDFIEAYGRTLKEIAKQLAFEDRARMERAISIAFQSAGLSFY